MIGIKCNNRWLDLKPGLSAETERKSPFFALSEVIQEYTTPIGFKYTENNALALGFIYQFQTRRQKTKVEVELYEDNTFECRCFLVVETGRMNLNNLEASEMTGYLLFGASHFYQQIKDKQLSDLTLGGIRSFNYTTHFPADGTNGYWQHFHKTWTDATIPYVMQPIRNEHYNGEGGDVEWMNKMNDAGELDFDFKNPIVPMIRLKYLLECIFTEFGYTIDFSGLNDTTWERLLAVNLAKVDWVGLSVDTTTNLVVEKERSTLQINLKNHVPAGLISDFVLQRFNRYGWAPIFSLTSRHCRLVAVKELGKGTRKDWTQYAEPEIPTSFNEDEKIYSFKNEIPAGDAFPVKGDFTNVKLLPQVFFKSNLQAPTGGIEGRVCFVFTENRWYQVQFDDTLNDFVWNVFSENIFDYEQPQSKDTISTTISPLPVYFTQYRHSVLLSKDYYGEFPVMQQKYNTPVGYRDLLYHGMVLERESNGTTAGTSNYPYASNHKWSLSQGGPFLAWSNTYTHHNNSNGVNDDYGIITYWWNSFLNLVKKGEEVSIKLWLPLHELIQFRWDDEIQVNNISFLLKSFVKPMPYRGFVVAKAKRIEKKLVPFVVNTGGAGTGGTGTPGTAVVYARLTVINLANDPTDSSTKRCDLRVSLYSDAAGTVPYSTPSTLFVLLREVLRVNGNVQSDQVDYCAVNGSSTIIRTGLIYSYNGPTFWQFSWNLEPGSANNYVVI